MIIQPSFLLRKTRVFDSAAGADLHYGVVGLFLRRYRHFPLSWTWKRARQKRTVFESHAKCIILQTTSFLYRLIFGTKTQILRKYERYKHLQAIVLMAWQLKMRLFSVISKQYEKGSQKGSKEISSDWRSAVDLKGNWEEAREEEEKIYTYWEWRRKCILQI